jgi:hypothetical protein
VRARSPEPSAFDMKSLASDGAIRKKIMRSVAAQDNTVDVTVTKHNKMRRRVIISSTVAGVWRSLRQQASAQVTQTELNSDSGRITGKPETIGLKMRTGDLGVVGKRSPAVALFDLSSFTHTAPGCCYWRVPVLLRTASLCDTFLAYRRRPDTTA